MAEVTATASKWYHKGWPMLVLGLFLGGAIFAAPIALAYGWVKRKVQGALPAKQ